MNTPLLSICIPTMNRAKYLIAGIYKLAQELKETGDQVEVIIFDDGSTDDTPVVVQKSREWLPVQFKRSQRDIGFTRTVLALVNEAARGEYIWLLGDDDFIRRGAVQRILRAIQETPDIDYFFINAVVQPTKKCPDLFDFMFTTKASTDQETITEPSIGKKKHDIYIERWEELLDPEIDPTFLTTMACGIFRRSCWNNFQSPKPGKSYSTLFDTYPVAVMNGSTMIGRKAAYLSEPGVTHYYGHQNWIRFSSWLTTVRKQDLLDFYLSNGIDQNRIDRCREALVKDSVHAINEMIINPKAKGRKDFNLNTYVEKNKNCGSIDYVIKEVLGNIIWDEFRKDPNGDPRKLMKFCQDLTYLKWLSSKWAEELQINSMDSTASEEQQQNANLPVIIDFEVKEALEKAERVVSFSPDNRIFMDLNIPNHPNTHFSLVAQSEIEANNLHTKYQSFDNVKVALNEDELASISNINFAYSFLFCQKLPRTIWIQHLCNVYRMLSPGGVYIFQFSSSPDRSANDSFRESLLGLQMYAPSDMIRLSKIAGFQSQILSSPYEVLQNKVPVSWYLCKLTKI